MEKRWLTARETSEYLSLNLKTVYSLVTRGELKAGRVGGSIRIDKKAIDEKLEKR